MKRWLLVPLVALALLVALYLHPWRREPFHVSGFLEADEIRVGSRVGGRVAAVKVEEGDRVTAGQTLVELEPHDLLERKGELAARVQGERAELLRLETGSRPEEIEEARAQVARWTARLERARSGPRPQEIEAGRARVEAARAALELADLEEERTRQLVSEQIRAEQELDRIRALQRSAQAEMRESEEELALLEEGTRQEEIAETAAELAGAQAQLALLEHGARSEDVDAARARVAAAEAALAALERSLAELQVRAPLDAWVEALDLEPGDLVAPDAPVLSLQDPAQLWVRAYVPQGRLSVTLGDRVWATVDAFADRRFAARVTFIAREAEFTPSNVQTPEERSQQVFRIRATLEEGLDVLRPGISADLWFEGDEL